MRIIHSDARAIVAESMVILDGVTYPLSTVVSIETEIIKSKGGWLVSLYWMLGTLFCLIAAFLAFSNGKHGQAVTTEIWLVGGLGGYFILYALLQRGVKTNYALVMNSLVGSRTVFVSEDRSYIDVLRQAIEFAIRELSRGDTVPRAKTFSLDAIGAPSAPNFPDFARAVFIDVETTGLHSTDRIVSLGLALLDMTDASQPEISTAHLIFDPGRKSHPKAEELHGYSDWVLRHQPPFASVAEDIHALIASADLVVAHNADFDLRFLDREFGVVGLDPIKTPVYCTMQAWRDGGYGGSASLSTVTARLGLARVGERHDALEDAWLAMQIFAWMAKLPITLGCFTELRNAGPSNFREVPPQPEGPLPRRRRALAGKAGTTRAEPGNDPR